MRLHLCGVWVLRRPSVEAIVSQKYRERCWLKNLKARVWLLTVTCPKSSQNSLWSMKNRGRCCSLNVYPEFELFSDHCWHLKLNCCQKKLSLKYKLTSAELTPGASKRPHRTIRLQQIDLTLAVFCWAEKGQADNRPAIKQLQRSECKDAFIESISATGLDCCCFITHNWSFSTLPPATMTVG